MLFQLDNVLRIELDSCNGIWVIEMIKDGGSSFVTQLKIEFLPLNNCSKKCLEKSLLIYVKLAIVWSIFQKSAIFSFLWCWPLKTLKLLFSAWNLYCCVIIFEINPSAIFGDPVKNQYHTPYPYIKKFAFSLRWLIRSLI